MISNPNEVTNLSVTMLGLFPPSIRNSLVSDPAFRNDYGIEVDTQISFGDRSVSIQRSSLYSGIREALAKQSTIPILKDINGENWQLKVIKNDNECHIELLQGERRLILSDFSAISPEKAERLNGFERNVDRFNLSKRSVTRWREILSKRSLSDDELDEIKNEISETPVWVASEVISEMKRGVSNLSLLIPYSERYFNRLVGECQQSLNIIEFANKGASEHIHQLISWRPYDGFLLSLLLSSHSLNSTVINIDQLNEQNLIQAFDWLMKNGDRISQIGAIEIGLSIIDRRPQIGPYIKSIIEQIRDDNIDNSHSRFSLLSALIILVEGELARTKILREKPLFWQRLASIAQASLLERSIIGLQVNFSKFIEWALYARGQHFYLQNMSDLRREPYLHLEYVSKQQLKAEFISRIFSAAHKNASKLKSSILCELLLNDGPGSIKSLIEFPFSFLPGPLEGGPELRDEPPDEIVKNIEEHLKEDIIKPSSFVALLNAAELFRLNSHYAQLAVKALRAIEYQLKLGDNKKQIFSFLKGLSTVAATTRSNELAEELKILTRRYMQESKRFISIEEAMEIGLIAAASHSEKTDWCEFVGEWITELAFQPMQPDEMKILHSHVEQLCQIVPELWYTCGRAEAALNI